MGSSHTTDKIALFRFIASDRGVGINDHGDIVRTFTNDGGTFHGFLLTRGRFVTIDVPGASSTNAQSINNSGEIVGISRGAAERGFFLSRGRFVAIEIPGALSTQATGINDRGQVVGTFEDSHGQHGFLIDARDLASP